MIHVKSALFTHERNYLSSQRREIKFERGKTKNVTTNLSLYTPLTFNSLLGSSHLPLSFQAFCYIYFVVSGYNDSGQVTFLIKRTTIPKLKCLTFPNDSVNISFKDLNWIPALYSYRGSPQHDPLSPPGKGYSQTKLGGMCDPLPKTLNQFMTKSCDFPYPIYDQPKIPFAAGTTTLKIIYEGFLLMVLSIMMKK